jgi:trimethylamine--corrinoid protein Co-methyltransferase
LEALTAHTQARFRTEHSQSALADRQGYDAWVETGSADTVQRAHRIWRAAVASYEPPPMALAVRGALDDYVAPGRANCRAQIYMKGNSRHAA